jgi:vacuolar-type H+-ATPase subunit H
MTAPNGSSPPTALVAVRRLESTLEERNDAHGVATAALDAARATAEGLLAEARAAGTDAGRRRRAELLAKAEADATGIRASGDAEAEELLRRVSAERDELVAVFTAAVLFQEA